MTVDRRARLRFCRDVDRGGSSEAGSRPDRRLVVVIVAPASAYRSATLPDLSSIFGGVFGGQFRIIQMRVNSLSIRVRYF